MLSMVRVSAILDPFRLLVLSWQMPSGLSTTRLSDHHRCSLRPSLRLVRSELRPITEGAYRASHSDVLGPVWSHFRRQGVNIVACHMPSTGSAARQTPYLQGLPPLFFPTLKISNCPFSLGSMGERHSPKDMRIRLWSFKMEAGATFDMSAFGPCPIIQSVCLSSDGTNILVGVKGCEVR